MKSRIVFAGLSAAFLLASCSYQLKVTESENRAAVMAVGQEFLDSTRSYGEILKYGRALGQSYIETAGTTSTKQDLGFYALLGIATLGASRAIDGASAEILGQFAVGGVAANQSVNYTNASGATQALIKASEQMNCLVLAGTSASSSIGMNTPDEFAAKELLLASFDTVRVNLRKALLRQLPDYSTLVENFAKSAEESAMVNATRNGIFSINSQQSLATLKKRAAKCVI